MTKRIGRDVRAEDERIAAEIFCENRRYAIRLISGELVYENFRLVRRRPTSSEHVGSHGIEEMKRAYDVIVRDVLVLDKPDVAAEYPVRDEVVHRSRGHENLRYLGGR